MPSCTVENLVFTFPDDWMVSKYDEWAFYTKQFQQVLRGGVKAVDLIAIDPAKTVWLVEVKDYRVHRRTKPSELWEETAEKVFDTLAGLLPAQVGSPEDVEQKFAKRVHQAKRLRVVVHLEQPEQSSHLYKVVADPANLIMKLRQVLKAVDAHPTVRNKENTSTLGWSVVDRSRDRA